MIFTGKNAYQKIIGTFELSFRCFQKFIKIGESKKAFELRLDGKTFKTRDKARKNEKRHMIVERPSVREQKKQAVRNKQQTKADTTG